MENYSLAHVDDAVLLRELAALVARDRLTTAMLLAHIAEVDARRLYIPAGYSSMHGYCVDELRLSEDAAYKRIQAARAARQFPELFLALAEGRLHLAGVCLLAPHLTADNADELIRSAGSKRKSEIEVLLARRFGKSLECSRVRVVPAIAASATLQLAPGQVEGDDPSDPRRKPKDPSRHPDDHQLAPGQVDEPREVSERYFLQVTIAKETYEKLRYAQALLSHALPNGEIAPVLDRALDLLVTQLEKRKFAASRSSRRVGELRKDVRALRVAEERARAADEGWRRAAVEQTRDVLAGLRNLGYRSNEARRAAEYCEALHGATLEERLRAAISYLGGRHGTRAPAGVT